MSAAAVGSLDASFQKLTIGVSTPKRVSFVPGEPQQSSSTVTSKPIPKNEAEGEHLKAGALFREAALQFQKDGLLHQSLQRLTSLYTEEKHVYEILRNDLKKERETNCALAHLCTELEAREHFHAEDFIEEQTRRAAFRTAIATTISDEDAATLAHDLRTHAPKVFATHLQEYDSAWKLRLTLNELITVLQDLPFNELLVVAKMYHKMPLAKEPSLAIKELAALIKKQLELLSHATNAIEEQLLNGFKCCYMKLMHSLKKHLFSQGVNGVFNHCAAKFVLNESQVHELVASKDVRPPYELFEMHQVDMGESDEINSCLEQIAHRVAIRKTIPEGLQSPIHKAAIRALARQLLPVSLIVRTLRIKEPTILPRLVEIYRFNKQLRNKLWKAFNELKLLSDEDLACIPPIWAGASADSKQVSLQPAPKPPSKRALETQQKISDLWELQTHTALEADICDGFRHSVRAYVEDRMRPRACP